MVVTVVVPASRSTRAAAIDTTLSSSYWPRSTISRTSEPSTASIDSRAHSRFVNSPLWLIITNIESCKDKYVGFHSNFMWCIF
ncbi:hypothetical protein SK128_028246 [Halocaridina rubra]|uniref:Uncharacterized protein n=1 Tax=Halocaridina rubra TaxID=373956 RepID=A0AAN8XPR8_HALRR